MCYTDIYSNIIVYQKYIETSIKLGYVTRSLYASSGPKAEGIFLLLLVRTPSAFGPELAYKLRVAYPTLADVALYFWYVQNL